MLLDNILLRRYVKHKQIIKLIYSIPMAKFGRETIVAEVSKIYINLLEFHKLVQSKKLLCDRETIF